MNLIIHKSVLLFLVLFQETACLNSKSIDLISKKIGHTAIEGAYLHHWYYSFTRLRTHSYSKNIVQRCLKRLTILERTKSLSTHINSENGSMASVPELLSTGNAASHTRDELVESKGSAGIFSLTAKALGSYIAKGKPRSDVPPVYPTHNEI